MTPQTLTGTSGGYMMNLRQLYRSLRQAKQFSMLVLTPSARIMTKVPKPFNGHSGLTMRII